MTLRPRIEVLETKVLSDNWYVLRKVTYRMQRRDGTWDVQSREAYDRGNGATILLYNKEHGIASGAIQDGKTIMLLQYAALHIFGERTDG